MKKRILLSAIIAVISVAAYGQGITGSVNFVGSAIPTGGSLGSSLFGATPSYLIGGSGNLSLPVSDKVNLNFGVNADRNFVELPGNSSNNNNSYVGTMGATYAQDSTQNYDVSASVINLTGNSAYGVVNGFNLAVNSTHMVTGIQNFSYSYGLGYTVLVPNSTTPSSVNMGDLSIYSKGEHGTAVNGYISAASALSQNNNFVGSGISFLTGNRGFTTISQVYRYYGTTTPWIGGSDYITINPIKYSYNVGNLPGVTLSLDTGVDWLNYRKNNDIPYSTDFYLSPGIKYAHSLCRNTSLSTSANVAMVQPLNNETTTMAFYTGVLTAGVSYQFQ
ncbi:MAG: hypothetical protein NTX05_03985 [Fusobacteria bacterium]|nr:hypothetical protein [Fusobacteriota bacterium]